MAQSGTPRKVANGLVSASCAAVLAVYTAGYDKTQSAANRFAAQVAERQVAPVQGRMESSPFEFLRPPKAPAVASPKLNVTDKPRVAVSAKPTLAEPSPAEIPAQSPSAATVAAPPVAGAIQAAEPT